MNTLLIRADADSVIGGGHVMRCFALAEQWKAEGGRVVFVSRCESRSLRGMISSAGFEIIDVERTHPDTADLRVTEEVALKESRTISKDSFVWLVLLSDPG